MELVLTPTIVAVSRQIYDERDPKILPGLDDMWHMEYVSRWGEPTEPSYELWFTEFIGRYMLELSEKDDVSRLYGSPLFWFMVEGDRDTIRQYITPEIALDCVVSFIKEYVELLDYISDVVSISVGCSRTSDGGILCGPTGEVYVEDDVDPEVVSRLSKLIEWHHSVHGGSIIDWYNIDLYSALARLGFRSVLAYRFILQKNSEDLLFAMYIDMLTNGRESGHPIIDRVLGLFDVRELKIGSDHLGSAENINNLQLLMSMKADGISASLGEFHLPRLYTIMKLKAKIIKSQ